ATPYFIPAGMHFSHCLKRFGSPIICLNLVKVTYPRPLMNINEYLQSKEKRRHECLLTDELESATEYLNQFLPPEHHIQYKYLDMAKLHRYSTIIPLNIPYYNEAPWCVDSPAEIHLRDNVLLVLPPS
uniref:Uncharacterized protein n=1 Tax=Amphimedon queenslandica TaxID=400682 RepID=A0A1X7T7X3_AMPQE